MYIKQLVKFLIDSIKIAYVIIIIINTLLEHFHILLIILSFDLKYNTDFTDSEKYLWG